MLDSQGVRLEQGSCQRELGLPRFPLYSGTVRRVHSRLAEVHFYLDKHLRYAEAFASEELTRREDLGFRGRAHLCGTPDERSLWQKRLWCGFSLSVRPFLYFFYRYFLRLGSLDGWNGFVFHFLQGFWFRLIVDLRMGELRGERPSL